MLITQGSFIPPATIETQVKMHVNACTAQLSHVRTAITSGEDKFKCNEQPGLT